MEMGGRIRRVLGCYVPRDLGVGSMRVTKEMGFKPCPFCGSIEYLDLMSRERYENLCSNDPERRGHITLTCQRCSLDFHRINFYSLLKDRDYDTQVEMLRNKWNRRAEEE